jgi:two-component system chemotaxis response regulator CheY
MKVLIVDDSRVMRRIVRNTLRQAGYEGLDVAEAGDGQEALQTIASDPPDFILSDWNMPVMSGIEFLTELRGRGNTTPFGFVTSEGTDDMRQRAIQAGANFYLAKPFTPEDVATALKGILG